LRADIILRDSGSKHFFLIRKAVDLTLMTS